MGKVKLTVLSGSCRCGTRKTGDPFPVGDLCPPICHGLWNCAYPMVYALRNGADLDFGTKKETAFCVKCPDEGRVILRGEAIN